jgi:superfamily II DNA or RNA helicase
MTASLRDASLPPVLNTSANNLIADFFEPALTAAVRYDRGVGFFSASWLRLAAAGMASFASNGGRARWVTSPILSEDDWKALQLGEAARTDAVLRRIIERDIKQLERTLEEDTLSALAWLVADNVLEFKLALPRNKLESGEFHDKFGIFADTEGNLVSFNGSYNDSVQGTLNYESIKVFCSWRPEFTALVQDDVSRFERLWNDSDPNVRAFELPDAARERIVRLRTKGRRPYSRPSSSQTGGLDGLSGIWEVRRSAHPHLPPDVTLRGYQETALEAWYEANCRGVLEMATGTGKTMTALAGAVNLFDRENRLLLLVCCPYKHLVEQWAEEAERFGFRPVRVAEARQRWEPELATQLRSFGKRRQDVVTIVTTNAALQGPLAEHLAPFWGETLIVVDEVHYAGAPKMIAALPPEAPWRLGLSATPARHYDEEGSNALLDYFEGIIFEFGLEQAIGPYLTPYYYHPVPVDMTSEEFDEFSELTRKLQRYMGLDEDKPMPEEAKKIAILRARVLNNSTAKLDWLRGEIEPYAKIRHTLFYVGDRLFEGARELLGSEKRIRIHEFTHNQNNKERSEILGRFARGDLQALVAMKCLDEGVDVPPTRTAYFLASSGNPREFVQRRGRVLRRAEGKEYATIYDLVSMPPRSFVDQGSSHPDWVAVRAAARRELRRIKEFAELAENRYQALDQVFDVANKLGLLDV